MISEVKDGITFGDLPNKYEVGTMVAAQVIAFAGQLNFLIKLVLQH